MSAPAFHLCPEPGADPMYVALNPPLLRRHYHSSLEFVLEVRAITRRRAWKRRRPWIRGEWVPYEPPPPEPMPSPELLAAERRLLAAALGQRHVLFPWIKNDVIHFLQADSLEVYGYLDGGDSYERVLGPALARLSAEDLLALVGEGAWAFRDGTREFDESIRARMLGVRLVPSGDAWELVVDWQVEVDALTEETVRHRTALRALAAEAEPAEERSRWISERAPSPGEVEAQRHLLEAVLAERSVFDAWVERRIVRTLARAVPEWPWNDEYEHRLDDRVVLAPVLATLPNRWSKIIEEALARDSGALSDFHDSLWVQPRALRVRAGMAVD